MEKSLSELAKVPVRAALSVGRHVVDHMTIKAWSELPADPTGQFKAPEREQ